MNADNTNINTNCELRDLIAVDYRELYVSHADLDDATANRLDREADERCDSFDDLTMADILEG